MPIVIALRNDNLKEHHWKEIKDLIGQDFDVNEEEFTLNSLIDLNAVTFQEEIQLISTQASQEASLRGQINALEEQWKRIDFITRPYKDRDAYILDEIDEIFQCLDESLAAINTILGSRFVKPLRTEAEIWKKNLFTLNQMVEEWITCQK
jgi:dynein heavy chain